METAKWIASGFVLSLCAGVAMAQYAGHNTAGPTRNDYRLHVVQPLEGATITGTRLQVIVDTEIPAETGQTQRDLYTTPRPDVDVFVDGVYLETMRDERNVVNVDEIQPGRHTIVVIALNRSREIIDRKEIHVSVIAPKFATAPAAPARPVQMPSEPAPAPAYVPPPPVTAENLPKTGTSDPLLAALGFALLLGGLAVRRFA